MEPLMVFITCPNDEEAARLARAAVAETLAACGNIVPGLRSIYRWQGEVHDDPETLLILKTSGEKYPALEACIQELHPYDVPEILALPVQRGLGAYLDWMADSLS